LLRLLDDPDVFDVSPQPKPTDYNSTDDSSKERQYDVVDRDLDSKQPDEKYHRDLVDEWRRKQKREREAERSTCLKQSSEDGDSRT